VQATTRPADWPARLFDAASLVGAQAVADLTRPLTCAEAAVLAPLLKILNSGRPVRALVMAALDDNGDVADQAAFDLLVAVTDGSPIVVTDAGRAATR
jgi:hypothetical protein